MTPSSKRRVPSSKRRVQPNSKLISPDCWQIVHTFCCGDLKTTLALRVVSSATTQPLIRAEYLPSVHRMLSYKSGSWLRHTDRVATLAFVAGRHPATIRLGHLMRWCVQQQFHVADWLAAWTDPDSGLSTCLDDLVLAYGVSSAAKCGDACALRILGSAPFNADGRHCHLADLHMAMMMGRVQVVDALTQHPYGMSRETRIPFPFQCVGFVMPAQIHIAA